MRMATTPKFYRLNTKIVRAFEAYCEKESERPAALLERLMKEFLKSQKAWQPKENK